MDLSLQTNFVPWQWLIPPLLPEQGCFPPPAAVKVEAPKRNKLRMSTLFIKTPN